MTTPRVRFVATAASTALPPDARTSRPTEEARWCGEATQPEGNRRASTPPVIRSAGQAGGGGTAGPSVLPGGGGGIWPGSGRSMPATSPGEPSSSENGGYSSRSSPAYELTRIDQR